MIENFVIQRCLTSVPRPSGTQNIFAGNGVLMAL